MSDTTLYGLCELARKLEIPESTTRYYRDVFAPYVPSVGMGRRRRYPEEALSVLRFVADSFAAGYTREEIARALAGGAVPDSSGTEPNELASSAKPPGTESTQLMTSLLDGEREQRELMWQMIRELSRFGDAIERQHYVLSELVEHVFHTADRRLPTTGNGDELEGVVDAEVVSETSEDSDDESGWISGPSQGDVDALRKALETERDLVDKLRRSKLDLERRAAAAETELEYTREQEPSLLRRIFDRNRGR